MKITAEEFDRRLKKGGLWLALIGMSNIGKSYRSKKLREENQFVRLCVDDLIEKKLGLEGIEAVAHWMGFPFEKRYAQAEKSYLEAEAAVMKSIKAPAGKNLVVDTTGSLIYLPPQLLAGFKKKFLIVHFEVVAAMIPEMTERFFVHPKPVIWGGFFNQQPKESIEVALRRCYAGWLKFRLEKYRELADLNLPALSLQNLSGPQFLETIQKSL